MFDCSLVMLGQLIDLIPVGIGFYCIFDFIGSLLFGKGSGR